MEIAVKTKFFYYNILLRSYEMKSIDEGTINQYKWLKIAQAAILIVLGFIFIITGWLSDEGINDALSYCLGVVFAAYGTMNIVAGYLLHRTALNATICVGILAIGFAVIFFFRASLLEQILSPFLTTVLFGVGAMLIVNGVDKCLSGKKTSKAILEENAKEDDKDFEKIKQLKSEKKQAFKSAAIVFVIAFVVISMSIVYLVFYLTQQAQVERYLVIFVGAMTFAFGIFSLTSTLKQIRNTKDMMMEEKMKEQTPTYNDSNEVKNTDVRIIDISELKSRKRKRKTLPKPKPNQIEDTEKKEEFPSLSTGTTKAESEDQDEE